MPDFVAKQSDVRKYRLIPVDVEAIQLTTNSVREAALWCGGVEVEEIDPTDSTKRFVALNVPTMDGVCRCQDGNYVVKNSTGDFKIMSRRKFEETYEPITQDIL